eukprot:2306809-Prymnesium_polylepis.1
MACATAPDATRARSARPRSIRTVRGGSRAARRLDSHQDLHGLSNARQLLVVVLDLRSTAPSRSRT